MWCGQGFSWFCVGLITWLGLSSVSIAIILQACLYIFKACAQRLIAITEVWDNADWFLTVAEFNRSLNLPWLEPGIPLSGFYITGNMNCERIWTRCNQCQKRKYNVQIFDIWCLGFDDSFTVSYYVRASSLLNDRVCMLIFISVSCIFDSIWSWLWGEY